MKSRPEVAESERRLLHALLLEHEGLNLEDVASELGLTRQQADSLLDSEMHAGVVDLHDDGVYVSLRKMISVRSADARADLALARHAARTKKRALVVGVPSVAIAVALVGYGLTYGSRSAEPEPPKVAVSPPPSHAGEPSFHDRVDARLAGERRRQWEIDAADREQRLAKLDAAAADANCAKDWSAGASCYVSHRNMTRAEFDEERALLAAELAKFRRLLEQSR